MLLRTLYRNHQSLSTCKSPECIASNRTSGDDSLLSIVELEIELCASHLLLLETQCYLFCEIRQSCEELACFLPHHFFLASLLPPPPPVPGSGHTFIGMTCAKYPSADSIHSSLVSPKIITHPARTEQACTGTKRTFLLFLDYHDLP